MPIGWIWLKKLAVAKNLELALFATDESFLLEKVRQTGTAIPAKCCRDYQGGLNQNFHYQCCNLPTTAQQGTQKGG